LHCYWTCSYFLIVYISEHSWRPWRPLFILDYFSEYTMDPLFSVLSLSFSHRIAPPSIHPIPKHSLPPARCHPVYVSKDFLRSCAHSGRLQLWFVLRLFPVRGLQVQCLPTTLFVNHQQDTSRQVLLTSPRFFVPVTYIIVVPSSFYYSTFVPDAAAFSRGGRNGS